MRFDEYVAEEAEKQAEGREAEERVSGRHETCKCLSNSVSSLFFSTPP